MVNTSTGPVWLPSSPAPRKAGGCFRRLKRSRSYLVRGPEFFLKDRGASQRGPSGTCEEHWETYAIIPNHSKTFKHILTSMCDEWDFFWMMGRLVFVFFWFFLICLYLFDSFFPDLLCIILSVSECFWMIMYFSYFLYVVFCCWLSCVWSFCSS